MAVPHFIQTSFPDYEVPSLFKEESFDDNKAAKETSEIIYEPKESQFIASDKLIRVNKRNPTCIRKCLQRKILHPAQCHFLC